MSRIPHDLPRRNDGEDQPAPPSFIDILEGLLLAHDDSSEVSPAWRMERVPGRPFIRFQDKPMDDAHSRDISEQGLFLEYRTDAWVVSGTCFISLHRKSAEGY